MQDLKTLIANLKILESKELQLNCSRLQLAIYKGHLLLAIKAAVPHGKFACALKEYGCKTSIRTAQRQMQLALHEKLLKSKTTDLSQMTLAQANNIIKRKNKIHKEEIVIGSLELKYRVQFIAAIQSYEIGILFPIEQMQSISQKKHLKRVLSELNRILQEIQENPDRIDYTSFLLSEFNHC